MNHRIKTTIITLLLVVMSASALTAWWFWGRREPLPEGLVQANAKSWQKSLGRVESRLTAP